MGRGLQAPEHPLGSGLLGLTWESAAAGTAPRGRLGQERKSQPRVTGAAVPLLLVSHGDPRLPLFGVGAAGWAWGLLGTQPSLGGSGCLARLLHICSPLGPGRGTPKNPLRAQMSPSTEPHGLATAKTRHPLTRGGQAGLQPPPGDSEGRRHSQPCNRSPVAAPKSSLACKKRRCSKGCTGHPACHGASPLSCLFPKFSLLLSSFGAVGGFWDAFPTPCRFFATLQARTEPNTPPAPRTPGSSSSLSQQAHNISERGFSLSKPPGHCHPHPNHPVTSSQPPDLFPARGWECLGSPPYIQRLTSDAVPGTGGDPALPAPCPTPSPRTLLGADLADCWAPPQQSTPIRGFCVCVQRSFN